MANTCSDSLLAIKKGTSIKWLLFLFAVVAIHSLVQAQTYYYLQNKFAYTPNTSITCSIFLVINPEGNGYARVKFALPNAKPGDECRMHFLLKDAAQSGTTADTDNKWMIPDGQDYLNDASSACRMIFPRFVFTKQKQGNSYQYEPTAVEYSTTGGRWQPSTMLVNQKKTPEEIKKQQTLFLSFYKKGELTILDELFPKQLASATPIFVRKEKLYLVAIANTQDSLIGLSAATDIKNITISIDKLGRDMGMEIVSKKIMAESFSKTSVLQALKSIQPTASDIIFFYYSGHGFRFTEDTSKYPRMSFRTKRQPNVYTNNLSVEEVYKNLLQKKAKVTIVISDCCNNNIGSSSPQKPKEPGGLPPPPPPFYDIAACKALFFPPNRIGVLGTAADSAQLSAGYDDSGGIFTDRLNSRLLTALYQDGAKASWENILLDAKTEASAEMAKVDDPKLCPCIQTPRYRVTKLK